MSSGDDELFAIVTSPTGEERGTGVIVLAGGRYEQSSGRNRVARRLAQSLAAAGFHALRFDYHGVGDSTGQLAEFALDEPNLEDVGAAIAELRRRGITRTALIGDCFGGRTALAAAAGDESVTALLLVSLPWRDLTRSGQRASIVSSKLSVRDYARKGLTWKVARKLADPEARRDYWHLVTAKLRHLRRRASDRLSGHDLEPWISRHVIAQLKAVTSRRVPILLLYGRGALEEYTHDFELLRDLPDIAHLLGPEAPTEIRVLDQPISGYRNVGAQDEVVVAATAWFDGTLARQPAVI
jgi:pimeloyl-ACP methyl ester carboxylesterase